MISSVVEAVGLLAIINVELNKLEKEDGIECRELYEDRIVRDMLSNDECFQTLFHLIVHEIETPYEALCGLGYLDG
jgi:hypothetical protein